MCLIVPPGTLYIPGLGPHSSRPNDAAVRAIRQQAAD